MSFELVALEEIATILAGQSPPGSSYNESGLGLPFFQGKADFGESHPVAKKWCTEPRKIAEAGDILISVRAPVGPTNLAGERCCIGRGLAAVRPDERVATRDFVLWAIKQHEAGLVAKAQGSTFPAIGQKDLKELAVPLPPLDEQRQIVAILNRAARIERLRTRAAERSQEFVPALFVKMFGDPVDNPMRWRRENLGAMVEEFRYGTSGKCTTDQQTGDLPVLRIPNVLDGVVNWDDLKFRGFERKEAETLRLRVGDILFVRTNGNPNYIGRCAVYDGSRPAAYASYLIRARLSDQRVRPRYLADALALPSMRQKLLRLARTTAGNYNISLRSLASLSLPLPAFEHQVQYERLADKVRASSLLGEVAAEKATNLSSSMMAKLLLAPETR